MEVRGGGTVSRKPKVGDKLRFINTEEGDGLL